MRGLSLLALAFALSGAAGAPSRLAAAASLSSVRGTVLRLFGNRLLVGCADGTVEGFDATTRGHVYTLPGGDGPVRDVVSVNGRVAWCCEGSAVLRLVDSQLHPVAVDLARSGFAGPIRRLSGWRGLVVAHSDNDLRFFEPETGRVLKPADVLPKSVADTVVQGPLLCNWSGDRGLLFSVRRYGKHLKPVEEGGTSDIAMITAWSCDVHGDYRLLGSYTCSIVDFQDAPGPKVVIDNGARRVENSFGTAPLGNVVIGPEGVVALLKNQALEVPFCRNNWTTNWQRLPISPDYAQTAAFSASSVWWWSDGRLVQGNLEDGSCQVYSPRLPGRQVLSLAANDEGAWVLTDAGVAAVQANDSGSLAGQGFFHYALSGGAKPELSFEQRELSKVLGNAALVGRVARTSASPREAARRLIGAAKIDRTAKLAERRWKKARDVMDLETGDLVVEGKKTGLYLGDAQVLDLDAKSAQVEPLRLDSDTRAVRVLRSDGELFANRVVRRGRDLLADVFPVGIGRPCPSLGHSLYVRCDPGSSQDQPHTPEQLQLQQVIETWIGTPYVWGGSSHDGCDCSGFVMMAFRELGIDLPRYSQDIGRAPQGRVILDDTLHYGDVLVFPNPHHVAIYIGNGQTAEAVSGGVGYSTISRRRLAVVRRFLPG